jgi:hypothetical protein
VTRSARTLCGPANPPHGKAAGMHLRNRYAALLFASIQSRCQNWLFRKTCRRARLSSGSARGIAPPAFTLASPGLVRAMRGWDGNRDAARDGNRDAASIHDAGKLAASRFPSRSLARAGYPRDLSPHAPAHRATDAPAREDRVVFDAASKSLRRIRGYKYLCMLKTAQDEPSRDRSLVDQARAG